MHGTGETKYWLHFKEILPDYDSHDTEDDVIDGKEKRKQRLASFSSNRYCQPHCHAEHHYTWKCLGTVNIHDNYTNDAFCLKLNVNPTWWQNRPKAYRLKLFHMAGWLGLGKWNRFSNWCRKNILHVCAGEYQRLPIRLNNAPDDSLLTKPTYSYSTKITVENTCISTEKDQISLPSLTICTDLQCLFRLCTWEIVTHFERRLNCCFDFQMYLKRIR